MSRFGSDPRAFCEAVYREPAPWDIGDPQPAMAARLAEYPPEGPVLDVWLWLARSCRSRCETRNRDARHRLCRGSQCPCARKERRPGFRRCRLPRLLGGWCTGTRRVWVRPLEQLSIPGTTTCLAQMVVVLGFFHHEMPRWARAVGASFGANDSASRTQ